MPTGEERVANYLAAKESMTEKEKGISRRVSAYYLSGEHRKLGSEYNKAAIQLCNLPEGTDEE